MAMHDERRPIVRLGRYDGHEEIVLPAGFPRGGWLALLGLVLWPLPFVLKGGLPALVVSRGAALFVVLVIWMAPVVVCVILQIAWWLAGAERIAVIGCDLLLRHTICGLPVATWSFRGNEIRFLAPTALPPAGWLTQPALPFLSSHATGSLKFFYRERTVYIGDALDDLEARRVMAWLTPRLPARASEQVT